MSIITVNELAKAIKHKTGGSMGDDEISKLAEYVMGFFGFEEAISDSTLKPEDRDIFYQLEEMGLLTTRQDEVLLHSKKNWRIHYWVLKKSEILELARSPKVKKEKDVSSIYNKIGDEAWRRKG